MQFVVAGPRFKRYGSPIRRKLVRTEHPMKSNPVTSVVAAGSLSAVALWVLPACTEYQQQGAAVGALGGAALGALAGSDTDDVIRGAAIGAAAGTGAAALKEEHDRRRGLDNRPPHHPSAPPQPSGDYPKAFRTDNPYRVISPYKPNNVIDISNNPKTGQPFRRGDYAIDPSNGKIFEVP